MHHIESAQNPKIKQAEKLKNRRERKLSNEFLVEGYRELLRASEGDWEFTQLFFCPSLFLKSNEQALIEKIGKTAKLYEVKESLFKKLSYRDRPDGLIGVLKQKSLTLNDLKQEENPFYIIAESIEKPGNLGTILRSSDAAGVSGVIVTDSVTDIYNPNVVRASIGTLFTQPVVTATNQETFAFIKERNLKIVAASPKVEMLYTDAKLTGPIAVVVGSEQYGLKDIWYDSADLKVKIPMRGKADSLNVAQATTLVLYEIIRQRSL